MKTKGKERLKKEKKETGEDKTEKSQVIKAENSENGQASVFCMLTYVQIQTHKLYTPPTRLEENLLLFSC